MQRLFNVVAPLINVEQNVNVDISKKLMFTIWLLAKQESFLAVGDRFGIPTSTGYLIFKEVVGVLAQLMPQYIRWPNAAQQQLSSHVCYITCLKYICQSVACVLNF